MNFSSRPSPNWPVTKYQPWKWRSKIDGSHVVALPHSQVSNTVDTILTAMRFEVSIRNGIQTELAPHMDIGLDIYMASNAPKNQVWPMSRSSMACVGTAALHIYIYIYKSIYRGFHLSAGAIMTRPNGLSAWQSCQVSRPIDDNISQNLNSILSPAQGKASRWQ